MNTQKRPQIRLIVGILFGLILAACGSQSEQTESATSAATAEPPIALVATEAQATGAVEVIIKTAETEAAATQVPTSNEADTAEQTAIAEQRDDSAATTITLNDEATTISGSGATVDGSIVTITTAGTYLLQGTLSDGQIIVESNDDADVYLVLDGVTLSNSTTSPLFISVADEVVIELNAGSQNSISDGSAYVFADATTDEPNAAIFSKADMSIIGEGALSVTGNFNDGIASKDDLLIAASNITVTAVDDGIRGKDSVVIQSGDLTVDAQGNAIKSDNAEDEGRGYITISGGNLNLTAASKALNGENLITIENGTLLANSADDALHSNGEIVINAGSITLVAGDDAIHGNNAVTINGGEIAVTQSYEAIESHLITINDGSISIVSSDDGINIADGDTPNSADSLIINGGTILVDSGGDGLDSNAAIQMTGGIVIVNGPTDDRNSALDFDGIFTLTGGYFVATGSAGMAKAPSTTSTQNAILVNFEQQLAAGTLVHLAAADGSSVLTFAPAKDFQSLIFSSAELIQGETYAVYYGGSTDGEAVAGLYESDSYVDGTKFIDLTLTDNITSYGEVTSRRR